jgi:hypothetical protein
MPIRVECTRCQDVTHFADNDAGLAVACLSCGQHLRVPQMPKERPVVTPVVVPDEPPPLFANYKHDPDGGAVAPPVRQAARRAKRPAAGRSKWRAYGILLAVLGVGAMAVTYEVQRRRSASAVAQPDPRRSAPAATQPVQVVVASVKQPAPSKPAPGVIEKAPAVKPALASFETRPQPASTGRPYTPVNAPVGFVGLERLEYTGRLLADSYNAAAGVYGGDNVRSNGRLLSNGEILLAGDGELRGFAHPGPGQTLKPSKKVSVTGSTSPLISKLQAPPVRLDPFAHDSANANLPDKFFKNGNLVVYGKHTVAIPAGVYYLNDLAIESSATLHCDGPVTLLVSGQVSLAGTIEPPDNRPANCRIRVTGDRPIAITQKHELFVDLYAPQSVVTVSGKGDVYGSIVARRLHVNGRGALHFDESLKGAGE